MRTISFIGGGRITRIVLKAFDNAGIAFDLVTVYDINEGTLGSLKAKFSRIVTTTLIDETLQSDLVVLAVHPPVVMETLEKIKTKLRVNAVFLSLAPKFSIVKLEGVLQGIPNIARMNPSASAIINKGVNPVSFSASFDKALKESLLSLVKSLGYTPEVEDSRIEAYAVICAMGHTYFNFQLQKIRDLGVSFGMTADEAAIAVTRMLVGTAETLFNSGLSYDEVNDLVPVKPMSEVEETIKGYYDQYLNGIYNKIKP
jgi:pyrroline-5-carboxylate reductase